MHNPPAASAAGSSPSNFDEKTALTISQGVIGKFVGDYTLTATDGRRVRLSEYRGKPLVISLIYTSCYHICPTTTQHLAKVTRTARAALGPESFSVLSIGFDTPKDTPVAMRQFSLDQGIDISGWLFLSADAPSMEGLTKELGFISYRAPHGFDHLIQATVIDAQGKIYRQVYGMTFETPLLVEPLKELVFGKPVAHSFLSSLSNKIKLFCTVYDPTTDKYRFDYSIFMGLFIGASSIGIVSFLVFREWRRNRRRRG
ncbi:MAG: SCO family protein [Sulfuricaulis sp.]|uniref:SCO family protein n=1 Tax=Sulfuricaulis sp. TaxID=2003553 RepID=UPI0025F63407|nr:SCO family protein [Sulfuricaulis sp.]MCR4346673.1 SCO family protein [Sulfuricaulis sp.]